MRFRASAKIVNSKGLVLSMRFALAACTLLAEALVAVPEGPRIRARKFRSFSAQSEIQASQRGNDRSFCA